MAGLKDRLAALVVDWFVVLAPLLLVVWAPFKYKLTEAFILGDENLMMVYGAVGILLSAVLVMTYFTLFYFWRGTTVGKLIFRLQVVDIWNYQRPTLHAALVRSGIMMFEIVLFCLPCLTIFSNPRRRVLHDLLSETVVVSLSDATAVPPSAYTVAFFRGVQAAVLAFVVLLIFVTAAELFNLTEKELLAEHSGGGCAQVSEAMSKSEDHPADSPRLFLSMALFASGLLDHECLEQEAKMIFQQTKENTDLAYLALAFVHSDDPDRSNEYLDEVCKVKADGEACLMTKVVNEWANEDWLKVGEIFTQLKGPAPDYVRVWRIRFNMKSGHFNDALAELEQLNYTSAYANYTFFEKIKALWLSQQRHDAELMASVTAPFVEGSMRRYLQGWLCYAQTVERCGPIVPDSCNQLIKDGRSEISDVYARMGVLLAKEACDTKISETDIEYLFGLSNLESWQAYMAAVAKHQKGDRSEAYGLMNRVVDDPLVEEAFRAEGLRRLITWSLNPEELQELVEKWQKLAIGSRFLTAKSIFTTLEKKREWNLAARVGENILSHIQFDPGFTKQLMVVASKGNVPGIVHDLWKKHRAELEASSSGRQPASQDEWRQLLGQLQRKEAK